MLLEILDDHPAECTYWRQDPLTDEAGECVAGVFNHPSLGTCAEMCKGRVIKPGKLDAYRKKRKNDSKVIPEPTVPYIPRPALPRDQWPRPIQFIARRAIPSDAGVGDIVQRWAAKAGGEVFKRVMKAAGVDCGCAERQRWLNEKYPLT